MKNQLSAFRLNLTSDKTIILGYVVLLSVMVAIMSNFAPYIGDDLYFSMRKDNLVGFWEYVSYHYNGFNGRLADYSTYFMIGIFPKELFAIICGIMYGLGCYFLLRLVFYKRKINLQIAILVSSAMILCLPWHQAMFLRACLLNYVFTTGLVIPCVWLFINPPKNLSKIKTAGIVILSFVSAMMHEGFSAPVFVAFVVYAVVNRKLTKLQFLILVAFFIGMLSPLSSPGIWNRLSLQTPSEESLVSGLLTRLLESCYAICRRHFMMIVFLLISIVLLIKNRKNNLVYDKGYISFLFVIIIVSIFISACSGNIPRSYWLSNLISILLVGYLLSYHVDLMTKIKKRILNAFCICVCGFIIAHMIYSIKWEYKLNQEFVIVKNEYVKSDNGIVYADTFSSYDAPFLCLEKPLFDQFYGECNRTPFSWYYGSDEKYVSVVPAELEYYKSRKEDCISEEYEIFKTPEGSLITTKPFTVAGRENIFVILEDGSTKLLYVSFVEYENAYGDKYYYCRPINAGRELTSQVKITDMSKAGMKYNFMKFF